jgi:hypothetical protein
MTMTTFVVMNETEKETDATRARAYDLKGASANFCLFLLLTTDKEPAI